MTPHSPAFVGALAAASALLGPADATDHFPETQSLARVESARWGRGAACLVLRVYSDHCAHALGATRADGTMDSWMVPGDVAPIVRGAASWLGWTVPS